MASNIQTDEEINILLLGETGVGKSTFINAFANYLTYLTLNEAENNNMLALIPTQFTVTDDDYQEIVVKAGCDENESTEVGQSATQGCKCYLFPFEDYLIRLIDTPGIGDTRGIDIDRSNMDHLLAFIGQYKYLHAICILMKPNNSRLTVNFEFCIKQLLCQLQKEAAKNIIFVFTNARSTFYKPGETLRPLRTVLENVEKKPPHAHIELNKDSIYCVDNEAFRFLVALANGIPFDENSKKDFGVSWKHSSNECTRLMRRIIGGPGIACLIPHKVQDTISVNEARRLIVTLTQPLAEIAQNIQDNIKVLDQRKQEILDNENNIQLLKGKLYIPELDLQVNTLPYPATICADKSCCTAYTVAGISKFHYSQRCHPHCYLSGVPKEVLGDSQLTGCWAMNGTQNCRQCGHSYHIHMHVYYETTVVENQIVDKNIQSQIDSKEQAKEAAKQIIQSLEQRANEYRYEQDQITKATAKFAHFLKNNAIAAYNDSFKDYLEHLIENEKTLSKHGSNNKDIIDGLQKMLKAYEKEKEILENAMKSSLPSGDVKSEDVFKAIEELYNLKITGKKIEEFYKKQKIARQKENFEERQVIVKLPKHKKMSLKNMVWSNVNDSKKKIDQTVNGCKALTLYNY